MGETALQPNIPILFGQALPPPRRSSARLAPKPRVRRASVELETARTGESYQRAQTLIPRPERGKAFGTRG